MAIPEKYSHIDFTPPEGVRKEAENGLKLRREHGRGGTAVGIARARDLSNGKTMSPSTVRRMKAFFDRHQSDKSGKGFDRSDKEWPSNGVIASKLWGHNAGYSWAKKVVAQMNAADEKEGRSLRPKGSSFGIKPSVVVVHGPPSIKKSEYVAAKKGDEDVVFDFNKVMDALSGGGKKDGLVSYCTDIRTLIIDRAIRKRSSGKTWIIATRVSDEMRGRLSDINVDYVYVDTPKEDCLKETEGLDNEQEMRQVIEDYFTEDSESRFNSYSSGVERRFVGNFASEQKSDPELLRVERRADPSTGQRKTYVVGYAARFHTDSLLLGDFVERIDPKAFDLVEQRQDSEGRPLETRCLYNHDPNHLLGRFPTTMRLTVDDKGLKYECLLPESRSDIAESIERGDLKGSSFSFICADGGEKWSYENGVSTRLVTKIKALLDCGPVTYPAYGDATVAVAQRSYEEYRAFCATGSGGGVDNTCGAGTATAGKKSPGGGKKKAASEKKTKKAEKEPEIIVNKKGAPSILKSAGYGAAQGAIGGALGAGLAGAASGAVLGAAAGAIKGAIDKAKHSKYTEEKVKAIKKALKSTKKKAKRSHDELSEFLAERRGFCSTGDGGGIDNSCGSDGKGGGGVGKSEGGGGKLSSAVKGALVGAAAGALGGGLAGAAIGATALGFAAYVASGKKTDEALEKAKGEMGLDDNKLNVAAAAVFGKDKPQSIKTQVTKDGVIAMHGLQGSMFISQKAPVFGVKGKSNLHFDANGGGKSVAKDAELAAKSAGVGTVSVQSWTKDTDAGLKAAGFKQTKGFSQSEDHEVWTKDLSKKSSKRSHDELSEFLKERRAFCPSGSGGGVDNSCGSGKSSAGGSKYMEWDTKKDHKSPDKTSQAQEFIDKAREEQMSKGGKDGGMADEGGGVQTWSKGDHFPWTPKQVGTDEGYVQGLHPDGSKTEKYPFSGGDSSEAFKQMGEEIKRRKGDDVRKRYADLMEWTRRSRAS